jgi:hypothetical protein
VRRLVTCSRSVCRLAWSGGGSETPGREACRGGLEIDDGDDDGNKRVSRVKMSPMAGSECPNGRGVTAGEGLYGME